MSIGRIWSSGKGGKFAIIGCGLYLLYVLLGAIVLPLVVERVVEGDVSARLERKIEIEDIDFNPFTVSMTVEGISVEDDREEILFQAGVMRANFQMSTLLTLRVSFKELALIDGHAFVKILEEGHLNFEKLISGAESDADVVEDEVSADIGFWVGKVEVANFVLDFEDRALATAVHEEIGPVSFVAHDVHNKADGDAPYSFDVTIGESTTLSWEGTLGLVPLSSAGAFSVQGLDLSKGRPYWETLVNVDLQAIFQVSGTYSFLQEESGEFQFLLNETSMGMEDFRLIDSGNKESFAAWDSFGVSGVSVDLAQQTVRIGSVRLNGFEAQGILNEEGKPVMPSGPLLSDPASVPSDIEEGDTVVVEGTDWDVLMDSFVLLDGKIALIDRSLESSNQLSVSIDSIGCEARSLSISDVATQMEATLSGRINGTGQFVAEVSGNIPTKSFEGNYSLKGLDLTRFQPYVDQFAHVTLSGGLLGSEGAFSYREGRAIATNSVSLDEFELLESGNDVPLARWSKFSVDGINYTPELIVVDSIRLEQPYARIEQDEEGINLERIVLGNDEDGEEPIGGAEGLPREGEEADISGESEGIAYEVKSFVISEGDIDFKDTTFSEPFVSGLRGANLVISDVSSYPEQSMKIDLKSEIEGGSKLTVLGDVLPSDYKKYSGLDIEMSAYDLTGTEPYWEKYLGRKLDSGFLSIRSRYDVQGNLLKGANDIRIVDLELGEKVESEDSLGLPVGLAIALLQDPSGLIQLNPPISGDLEDPSVRIMPIVGKVFMNLILKAAISPFSFLGNLAGGKDNLDKAPIEVGMVALDVELKAHLESIADILRQRPKLNLDLFLHLDEEAELSLFKKAIIYAYAKSLTEANSTTELGEGIDPFEAILGFDEPLYSDVVNSAYGVDVPIEIVPTPNEQQPSDTIATLEAVDSEEVEVVERVRSVGGPKRRRLSKAKKEVETKAEVVRSEPEAPSPEVDIVEQQEVIKPAVELNFESIEELLWVRSGGELGDDFIEKLTQLRLELARNYLIEEQAVTPERVEVADAVVDGKESDDSILEFILK